MKSNHSVTNFVLSLHKKDSALIPLSILILIQAISKRLTKNLMIYYLVILIHISRILSYDTIDSEANLFYLITINYAMIYFYLIKKLWNIIYSFELLKLLFHHLLAKNKSHLCNAKFIYSLNEEIHSQIKWIKIAYIFAGFHLK